MTEALAVTRYVVLVAFGASVLVALAAWLVRTRRVSPFGFAGRTLRAMSDPLIHPVETRLVRAGGNPVNAGWWLVVGVAAVGVVLIAALNWAGRECRAPRASRPAGRGRALDRRGLQGPRRGALRQSDRRLARVPPVHPLAAAGVRPHRLGGRAAPAGASTARPVRLEPARCMAGVDAPPANPLVRFGILMAALVVHRRRRRERCDTQAVRSAGRDPAV